MFFWLARARVSCHASRAGRCEVPPVIPRKTQCETHVAVVARRVANAPNSSRPRFGQRAATGMHQESEKWLVWCDLGHSWGAPVPPVRVPGEVPGRRKCVPGVPGSLPGRLWSLPRAILERPISPKVLPKAPGSDFGAIFERFGLDLGSPGEAGSAFRRCLCRASRACARSRDLLRERRLRCVLTAFTRENAAANVYSNALFSLRTTAPHLVI